MITVIVISTQANWHIKLKKDTRQTEKQTAGTAREISIKLTVKTYYETY